jgi:SAM-dependent methyltransferase
MVTEQADVRYGTHLYIREKVRERASGRSLAVLDIGCGDGELLRLLHRDGHQVYGYDLGQRRADAMAALASFLPDVETRVLFTENERTIPFPSQMFDVVYSNQVLEHVKYLDALIRESARVLKPGGVHIALFPYVTYPFEGHVHTPFVHWIPPGSFRARYLAFFYVLRGYYGQALELGRTRDEYLRTKTYYRLPNEVEMLGTTYFDEYRTDVGDYLRARVAVMRRRGGVSGLVASIVDACCGTWLNNLVRYAVLEAVLFVNPRSEVHGTPTP